MILCLKKHHVAHVLSFSSKNMVQFVVPLRSRHLVTLLRRQWKTVASNGSYCRICKRLVAKGWGCGFFELLTVCTVESWWKLLKWVGLEDGDVQQNPNWLVVWTPLKNISHLGWLFPIYGKIKNVPNHQPVKYSWVGFDTLLKVASIYIFLGGCMIQEGLSWSPYVPCMLAIRETAKGCLLDDLT